MGLATTLRRITCKLLAGRRPARRGKRPVVLFGARSGREYLDNSRYLFEWVLEHRPEIAAVWMTRNRAVLKRLRAKGRPAVGAGSFRGLSLLATASAAVISNRLEDIAPAAELVPADLPVIFLGHGIPVKRARAALKDARRAAEWKTRLEGLNRRIRRAISTSPLISELTARYLDIPEDRLAITGYPRNDLLTDPPDECREEWGRFRGDRRPKSVILYAPTWRDGRYATRFFPFTDFKRAALDGFLRRHDTLLLLRPHMMDLQEPASRQAIQDLCAGTDFIRTAGFREIPDVNRLLPFVNILVSDYSSIYYDFLLLDRPLVFIPYDYERFLEEQGFMYDYHAHLPGPAINSWQEMQAYLDRLFAGEDPHREARERLKRMIHTRADGRACARSARLLDQLLQEGRT